MPSTIPTLQGIESAADSLAFRNAVWHATQARYWRDQKAHGSVVPAGRCEHHAHRHERRVIEIAMQSTAALAGRAQLTGAAA